MAEKEELIAELLDSILRSLDLTLWDLEFKTRGPQWLLRIFIDRETGGVTLNDCEAVSRDLGTALDVEDIIPHSYILEVSSPGLDRTLKRPEHFRKYAGSPVRIKTVQPVSGQKMFRGILRTGQEENVIIVDTENGSSVTIPMENVAKASLEIVL